MSKGYEVHRKENKMSTFVIVFIIWTIAAFIYSKAKGCGMFGAYFKVIFALFAGIFSEATSSSSGTAAAINEARRRTESAGSDEDIDKTYEKQAKLEAMHSKFTQMYNDANQSNNDND